MKYEYEALKVDDADVILIRHIINEEQFIVCIDTGNLDDWVKIKNHVKDVYNTTYIDLIILTHPDKDHKDGIYGLLNDNEIVIGCVWLTDPAEYLDENDIKRYRNHDNAVKAVRKIWSKSSDENDNLFDYKVTIENVIDGVSHSELPLKIVGPTKEYYLQVVKKMVEEYGIQTYIESSKDKYDDAYEIDEEEQKSVIDKSEDPSPYNASSLIVLYEPGDGKKLLFAGDANTTSLQMMLDKYKWLRNVDLLKVPHHGSVNNLNTKIIEELAPKKSYISAIGNSKHPYWPIVYWLSKYGDVYSTHAANYYMHWGTNEMNQAYPRENMSSLSPIKRKIK